jgi:hypothetical protein
VSAPEPPRDDLLDALRAVREAIDIPHPATVRDGETHDRILKERVLHAVVMLQNIVPDDGRPCAADVIPWSVEYLRARLAEHPASGYRTWAERVAEMERARQAERTGGTVGMPAVNDGDEPEGDEEDPAEDGQYRNRMACGDSLWDEEQHAEGAAMHCPRHGATSAITEEQWLADHPAEPIGFLVAEEAGDEDGGGEQP